MSTIKNLIIKIWNGWIRPHSSITDIEQRRQSGILSLLALSFSAYMFIRLLWAIPIRAPEARLQSVIFGTILLVLPSFVFFLLNRAGKYKVSAYGFVFVLFMVFSLPFLPLARTAARDFGAVFYIIWVLLFSSILLPWRVTLYLAGISLLVQLNYLQTAPPIETVPSAVPLSVTIGTALIISVSIWYRNGLERERRAELQSANAAIQKLNEELQKENAELERFTYTVSHELKSPIVTIKGFLGSIAKDIKDEKFERTQKDLLRVSNATDKMHDTLSDLLELSRIGRIANPPEEVDLVQLAHEALETVHGRVQARNITVHIAPDLPVVHGDRIRLREVYENLLDNAAKHFGDQPAPLIEIGARKNEQETVLFVKDNGMGIDAQYHKRIFGLFDKLDSTSEGTGIGLALIKRIIEAHGGRIWVESEGLGKGSTFCFTIPDHR